MTSLPIEASEVSRIGEEGFSGRWPKELELSGAGIGMNKTIALLRLNEAALVVQANVTPLKSATHDGTRYERNNFVVVLRTGPHRKTITTP
jgi:hypothetical protein